MIREVITYECTGCGITNIVKNGKNRYGKQQLNAKSVANKLC
jgi:hypothetical protein